MLSMSLSIEKASCKSAEKFRAIVLVKHNQRALEALLILAGRSPYDCGLPLGFQVPSRSDMTVGRGMEGRVRRDGLLFGEFEWLCQSILVRKFGRRLKRVTQKADRRDRRVGSCDNTGRSTKRERWRCESGVKPLYLEITSVGGPSLVA